MGAANVDAVDENGVTALMLASLLGTIDSVQYLYEIKADVNICGASGTAMHRAASGGHTDILKVTLRQRNVHEYLSSGAQMGIVRMYSPITCWRSIKCSSLAYHA